MTITDAQTGEREPGLLHRSLIERPQQVVSGSGIYLNLADGSRILDGCGGAAVSVIGHGNKQVQDAIMRQYSSIEYVHTMAYTTSSAEELANALTELSKPFGLTKAYFVCSGSEAIDAAMKLARQYHVENGQPQRKRFVARRQAYHGNTVGAMSVSSNLPRRIPYDGVLTLDNVSFVSPTYAYRGQRDAETEEQYAARLVQELDDEFQHVGPETVIAFVAETVGGATAACITPPKGYFEGVRRVCNRYGILLILDEIMCGSGRTGSYFAFEREGDVRPDLITLGKGLGGGYAPIAGVLIGEKVVQVLKRGSASFVHGHTYQAHPACCAAGLAVQQVIKRDNLVVNCLSMGALLESRLRSALEDAKYVGEIRGRGLFLGIEFVQDRASKQPFKPAVKFASRMQEAAHSRGLAVYPGSGTADGVNGDHVILAPPLTITEEEAEEIVRLLKMAYDIVEREVAL
ncbi:pyridoxal phosphate-dependent transferase [Trichoderma velutinum]